jgi:hypothetical protein
VHAVMAVGRMGRKVRRGATAHPASTTVVYAATDEDGPVVVLRPKRGDDGIRRAHVQQGEDTASASGIRAEESRRRQFHSTRPSDPSIHFFAQFVCLLKVRAFAPRAGIPRGPRRMQRACHAPAAALDRNWEAESRQYASARRRHGGSDGRNAALVPHPRGAIGNAAVRQVRHFLNSGTGRRRIARDVLATCRRAPRSRGARANGRVRADSRWFALSTTAGVKNSGGGDLADAWRSGGNRGTLVRRGIHRSVLGNAGIRGRPRNRNGGGFWSMRPTPRRHHAAAALAPRAV